ncbi:MAG: type II CAAX endopeptidase family protein [Pseudomonadota bacterium]
MIAFSTPANARKWNRWLVYSPGARIAIFIGIFAGAMFLLSVLFAALGWDGRQAPQPQRSIGIFLRQLLPALLAYLFLVYVIERRKPAELAWRRVVPDGLLGSVLGVLFIGSVVGVLWLAGSYEVTGTNPQFDWIRPLLLTGLGTAIAEEIIFRGVLFRISEEGLGTWWALAISALFFGGVHIMNKGATVWSSIAIAVEAGVLLGLAYNVTRSLPLVMGIHMTWNFTQGAIFGIPVSGTNASGYLVSTRPGPEWLSGGGFGAEASVVAVLISVVASAWLVMQARRKDTIFVRRWGPSPAPAIAANPTEGAPC